MSTHCKLIIGYTDHMGHWNPQKAYYRNSDGYITAIKPLLMEYIDDVEAMNNIAEYRSHEWEELEYMKDYGDCEYQYYLDVSDRNKILCSIVELDWEFYSKYNVDSYRVIDEFTITQ